MRHGERARVHPGDAGDPARAQPEVQPLGGAPVGRGGHVLLHHQAARGDGGRLLVLGIGADIADMGEGEGDDLPGKGRIGQGFLIAGHAGAEADLAHRRRIGCRRAEATAPEHRAVGQHQGGGGAGRGLGRRAGVGRRSGPVSDGAIPTGAIPTGPIPTGQVRPGQIGERERRWRPAPRASAARGWRGPGAICGSLPGRRRSAATRPPAHPDAPGCLRRKGTWPRSKGNRFPPQAPHTDLGRNFPTHPRGAPRYHGAGLWTCQGAGAETAARP